MTDPIQTLVRHRPWRTDMPSALREYDQALTQVENLVRAARTVSRTEATGVLPDFQPLADALAPFEDTP